MPKYLKSFKSRRIFVIVKNCLSNWSRCVPVLIRYFLFFSFLLLFEKFIFYKFQNSLIGQLYFSFDKGHILADIIALILAIGIIFQFFYKGRKRYAFSYNYYFFFIFFLLYYLSFRIYPGLRPELQFIFLKFEIFNIRYFDFIFGSWIIGMLIYRVYLKKKIPVDYTSKLENDNPIEQHSDDKLGYNKLAQKIVNEILTLKPSTRAFNIGINGEWGIGKTSLINMIINLLERKSKTNNSDHVIVKYSPLLINKSNNLTSDFLLKLNSALKKYSIESSNQFRQYIYSLTSKVKDIWSLIISIFYGDKNYELGFKELERILNKIDRRVITIIDDLDRLSKDEILEVLRLIRNICDFPDIIFVVAYDKSYLCEKLNKDGEKKAEKFLEKFFTCDVNMPLINQRLFREEIFKDIKRSIPGISHQVNSSFNLLSNEVRLSNRKDTNIIPEKLLDLCITTKRDLIRFINSLLIFDHGYFEEIIFAQLIILELLKLKYSHIHSSIKSRKILNEPNVMFAYYTINEDYLKELIDEYKGKEGIILKEALNILFYSDDTLIDKKIDKKSIINQNRFSLYFTYDESDYIKFSELERLRE